jgi:branched-chain amino acid transport system ATP-binding protein
VKLLDVKDLTTGYGDVEIIRNIDLYVERGEIVAIFGSNGSGKSTFLKAVAGLMPLWNGVIHFDAHRVDHIPPYERIRKGIALAPEGKHLFLGMSVEENLILGAWTNRERRKENLHRVYSYFPQLEEKRKDLAGDLSGGQQQMLSIGKALMSEPKLLMIDELSLGLAPAVVDSLAEILVRINSEEGISMLIVEQEVSLALEISNRAYVFDLGNIVDSGMSKELIKRDSIRRTYMGLL